MRGARHVCVQPPAAAGLQLRVGGCQQPGGARRVVLLQRYGGQRLEVVGGGWLVAGLGRQRQPLPEQSRGAVQVAPGLAGERQVVQGYEDREPIRAAAGRVQARGEQLGRAVIVSVAELDLAQEIADQGEDQQGLHASLLGALTGVRLPEQVHSLVQYVAGPCVVVLRGQHVPEGGGGQGCAQRIPRLAEQRQALLEGRPCLVLVAVGDEGEAGTAQGQGTLVRRHFLSFGHERFPV